MIHFKIKFVAFEHQKPLQDIMRKKKERKGAVLLVKIISYKTVYYFFVADSYRIHVLF